MTNSVTLAFCFAVLCAWLPARTIAGAVVRAFRLPGSLALSVTIIVFGSAGYTAFWMYYLDSRAGCVFTVLFFILGIVGLRLSKASLKSYVTGKLFLVMFLCGILYASSLDRFRSTYTGAEVPQRIFSFAPRSIDNLLPMWFATAIVKGPRFRTGYFGGDWTYSDRPPLQAGLTLLLRPAQEIFPTPVQYLGVSLLCQILWLPAMLSLIAPTGEAWQLNRWQVAGTAVLLVFTGFFYFNSVYTWPKLLSAAMVITCIHLLQSSFAVESKDEQTVHLALCGLAAIFALLAHTGSAYALLAVAIRFGVPAVRKFALRPWILSAALAIAMALPWFVYVRTIDPPGDRLFKWNLGNHGALTRESVGAVLSKAYSGTTLTGWISLRKAHLRQFFHDPNLDINIAAAWRAWRAGAPELKIPPEHKSYYLLNDAVPATVATLATLLRYDEVEAGFRTLGLLWLGLPIIAIRRFWRTPELRACALDFAIIGGIGFLLSLAMDLAAFVPRGIDYCVFLFLGIAGAMGILALPRPVAATIAGIHLTAQILIWFILVPATGQGAEAGYLGRNNLMQIVMIAASAAFVLATLSKRRASTGTEQREGVKAKQPFDSNKWVRLIAIASPALPVLLGLLVILVESRRPLAVDVSNVTSPERMLADSMNDNSYSMISFTYPAILRFNTGLLLDGISVRLFDKDQRRYRMTIDVDVNGKWKQVLNGASAEVSGLISIPLPEEPITALRITGLYNSRETIEPWNRLLHVVSLKLIRRSKYLRLIASPPS